MRHHLNNATFTLPALLEDKTMHTFTTCASAEGGCSVVMSHVEVQPQNTLADFAGDLSAGMATALPAFSLLRSAACSLANAPAHELAYRWQSGRVWTYQRQVMVFVPSAVHDSARVMLIAATCQGGACAAWDAIVDGLLASVELRQGADIEHVDAPSIGPSAVFALCAGRRRLHAFANRDEACLHMEASEVKRAAWRFFDATGKPLHARFDVPGPWWRKAGKFVLEPMPGAEAPTLGEQIDSTTVLFCSSPSVRFTSIAEVRASLDNVVEG